MLALAPYMWAMELNIYHVTIVVKYDQLDIKLNHIAIKNKNYVGIMVNSCRKKSITS